MASRRTRIKGIANIPQRRKTNAPNEEQTEPQIKVEDKSSENNLTFTCNNENVQKEPLASPQPIKVENPEEKSVANVTDNSPSDSSVNKDLISDITSISGADSAITSQNNLPNVEANKLPEVAQKPKLPFIRRKFIKPSVSASAIIRKAKQNVETESKEKSELCAAVNAKDRCEPELVINQDFLCPISVDLDYQQDKQYSVEPVTSDNITVISNFVVENEITLNETRLAPQSEIVTKGDIPDIAKKTAPFVNPNYSDSEYPPPPPSPTKINRSRIKAIPRFGYRKTSFSASESEDESRRIHNRNRNDSVCSVASGIQEPITECMSPQRPKEVATTVIQKKCSRTEQSRKIAEARREFQRRFGDKKPDRQRLTMIDLIFYNPTGSPMINETKPKPDQPEEVLQPDEVLEPDDAEPQKTNVDDPKMEVDTKKTVKSEEENEMPVPQIKIGPSGEIILDEQSLVIESKEVQKQREELEKTQLVNGDFDTGYGIYKRHKRAKDWTHAETLRFYKALNVIGTDFSLMSELFPRRNRRELKMKFKKEERTNRMLIDRAVMQPCSFDFVELKHEVDMEEREMEELQRQKEEQAKIKVENYEKLAKKRKALKQDSVEKIKLAQERALRKAERALKRAEKLARKEEKKRTDQPKPPKIRRVRKPKVRKLTIDSILEESDADESDIATQSSSESEEEYSRPLKATRSGRIPKVTRKFESDAPLSVAKVIKINRVAETTPRPNSIEPGSLMIISEKGPNGEPIYKIFMVTPDQNATPLNLDSDVVTRVIEGKKGLSAKNIMTISANVTDDENDTPQEENNITIPADEQVTTLKTSDQHEQINIPGQNKYGFYEENITAPSDDTVAIFRMPTSTKHADIVDNNCTIPADENVTSLRPKKNASSTVFIEEDDVDSQCTISSDESLQPNKDTSLSSSVPVTEDIIEQMVTLPADGIMPEENTSSTVFITKEDLDIR